MNLIVEGKALAAGTVAATSVVAGITGLSSAGTGAPAPAAGTVTCHRLLDAAPPALRTDLLAARTLPRGEQRRAAIRTIRKDAVHGSYGAAVERFAEQRKQHRKAQRARLLAAAPARLRTDLQAARALPAGEQRFAARQRIRKDALAGTYGPQVEALLQQRVDRRLQHRADCRAQSPKAAPGGAAS